MVQLYAERVAQADLSVRSDPHRPHAVVPSEPSQLHAAAQNFRADETRDMISALAPIEARPAENSSVSRRHGQFRAESGEKACAGMRDFTAVLAEDQVSLGHEHVGDSYPEVARQMVIACARKSQPIVLCRARLIARRDLDGGDGLDAFEHPGNERGCNVIIAIAALSDDRDEPRVGELGEVLACGWTGDP